MEDSIPKPLSYEVDDIECHSWLDEIELGHYAPIFLANFYSNCGENMLSRKKISAIKLNHFPRMGITNYSHQKILMEHIKLSLQYEYASPIRKSKALALKLSTNYRIDLRIITDENSPVGLPPRVPCDDKKSKPNVSKKIIPKLDDGRVKQQRSRSFDKDVWETIAKLRGGTNKTSLGVQNLRNGIFENLDETKKINSDESRTRRWSYGSSADGTLALSAPNKAILYGNMALKYDVIQKEIHSLQAEKISHFKDIIGCEMGHILFLSECTSELVMCIDQTWYRVSVNSSLEGACARNGETINVSNPYEDSRFNKNIDEATGIKTRNMLCHPLRMNRGGGRVVGVVRMLNKKGDVAFDDNDVDVLAACVQRVADDLHTRFKELLTLIEAFSSTAKLIVCTSTLSGKGERRYDGDTSASTQRRYSENTAGMQELIEKFKTGMAARDDKPTGPSFMTTVGGANTSATQQRDLAKVQRRNSYGREVRKLVQYP